MHVVARVPVVGGREDDVEVVGSGDGRREDPG